MKHLTWVIVVVMLAACGQDEDDLNQDQGTVSTDMARFFADIAGLSNPGVNDRLIKRNPSCVPVCKDRVCGDDGCGGACGSCDSRNDVACMANVCEAGQCEMRFHREGIGCDDTDPCTIGDTCRAGACTGVDLDTCGGVLKSCPLSGSTGDVVSCALYLASKTADSQPAAVFASRMLYDAKRVRLTQLSCPTKIPNTDETVDTCHVSQGSTLPPAVMGGSGHSILTNPMHPNDWNGNVKTLFFAVASPSPLSKAHLDANGEVVGNPQLVQLVFELQTDIPENAPAYVEITELDLSDGEGNTLKATLSNGIVVTK